MIFLTGHRASGKTTVGKILSELNFWVLDTGPYWRSLRDQEHPGLDVDLFFDLKRKQTDDPDWEDNHLANKLKEEYRGEQRTTQDLVVLGYRSLVEARHLASLIENEVFPHRPTRIWYVDCPFDIALKRYIDRDGDNASEARLLTQYEYEFSKGIKEMKEAANVIIDNSAGPEKLRDQTITYLQTEGYSMHNKERM